MRVRLWMKAVLIVPVLCLGGLSAAAQPQDSSQQQTGDPVADAARKAREAKKDTTKPKKVYTDDDIKTSAPEKAAPSSAAGDANGKATTTAQATGASAKAGEEPKEDRIARRRGESGFKRNATRLRKPKRN